jgi:hypothetical protein
VLDRGIRWAEQATAGVTILNTNNLFDKGFLLASRCMTAATDDTQLITISKLAAAHDAKHDGLLYLGQSGSKCAPNLSRHFQHNIHSDVLLTIYEKRGHMSLHLPYLENGRTSMQEKRKTKKVFAGI